MKTRLFYCLLLLSALGLSVGAQEMNASKRAANPITNLQGSADVMGKVTLTWDPPVQSKEGNVVLEDISVR